MDISGMIGQIPGLIAVLLRFRLVILGSVAVFSFGGIVFALMTPKVYQASQLFLIRDDIAGGRFQSFEWLKSAQETVQEVAKHSDVLRATLKELGPENPGWMGPSEDYPTLEDIEALRNNVWVSAPGGNEVGKTEMIRLNVKAATRDRALRLLQHISNGMSRQMRLIRADKAANIEAGRQAAVDSAQKQSTEITNQVIAMERSLGENLIELRSMMDDKSSSESALLKPLLLSLDAELVKESNLQSKIQQDIQFFQNGLENVSNLLGFPNNLLEEYQTLRELKAGLVAAQIQMTDVKSRYEPWHGKYTQAEQRLGTLENQIRNELNVSIGIAKSRLLFVEGQVNSLKRQREERVAQLTRLADLRAPYQNLMATQTATTNNLKQAQDELAQARAARLSAAETDLLTPMEEPIAGTKNVGSSRTMIVVGGGVCGIFVGLGLVMLLSAQPTVASPEALARWGNQTQP
ncbi:MAG: hypothetical protein JNK57_09185 [Planctomycetaceae bacterium]|jgi:uncharacterized protein involved in exopolysaccharide biosynthesis|nr:hypothetical protein [Planctomycetaceae bacterium]